MSKKEALTLMRGRDIFTPFELMVKAAQYKGLLLKHEGSLILSEPIATYVLDDALLTVLAENKIRRQLRPDCNNTVFTLVDENPQEKPAPGWIESDYWNFRETPKSSGQFDLKIKLQVSFHISFTKKGVVLRPKAYGTFLSPGGALPHFRMFKALVETGGKDLSPVVNELAQSDGYIIVTWTELNLGDIKKLTSLFDEFSKGRNEIQYLAQRHDVFHPSLGFANELFVTESIQPQVIRAWREQLEEYRQKLIL